MMIVSIAQCTLNNSIFTSGLPSVTLLVLLELGVKALAGPISDDGAAIVKHTNSTITNFIITDISLQTALS